MNRKPLTQALIGLTLLSVASHASALSGPKYVFFFLGDGMSASQIQATEAYLTTANGGDAMVAEDLQQPENRLNMSKMSVLGMQTTYDAYALMTDSASSATAFATGVKTQSGTIGMTPDLTQSVKSVAELAHEAGRRVAVLSSVSLNHATPAAYYASVPNRGDYYGIAEQLADSGYEFFGGGGLNKSDQALMDYVAAQGYTVLNDRTSILNLIQDPMDKVVAINPVLPTSSAMPYAIDKPAENLSLAEMTEVGLATLCEGYNRWGRCKSGEPFFMMVEGGKIDWACHANDAMATIGDMRDFDDAVAVALKFQKRHPLQTLIVVTGDHETGGMTVGHATTGYKAYYERLLDQEHSFEHFDMNVWPDHQAKYEDGYDWGQHNNLASNPEMVTFLADEFGLVWDELNTDQQIKLEDAYDKSMVGENNNTADENKLLYGGYNPITVTITHILNEEASIGWTSYSHTGVPVPVFAEGREAIRFAGFYDNTDIAKRLAKAMDLPSLPVYK
ncbi:Alkaline phosphatase [Thioflavicoccus mobilis 8321]|uniref:Alkaline phosphatase n=1 Tax=Thioflavicoccus mobilis 8321 TaxID=765912 RepID=L0GT17_9GAMM|nr:alkaline phosphatase [Thioflavicoccus mobilis]AGA89913.1 Alkaline phosphatase [Thioflavicoccus mobilis 8321]